MSRLVKLAAVASAIECIRKAWFRPVILSLFLSSSATLLARPYQGPIIDAHGHLGASFGWEAIVEAMDGIGEFIVRHWAYSPGRHAEQENPIESTFMRRMSAIATRFDVPMVIHMEGYPAQVDDFSKLLAEYPNSRFVWAHNCGRSKAQVIRAMLARCSRK